MDINNIITLTYSGMAIVFAIISATFIRVREKQLDTIDTFISLLSGVLWPFTIVGLIVYLASDFLYGKFFKVKEN